jgi:curved DNA-binding protein CbpA
VSGRSDADYQRYLDALHELGLEPGANADQIKKAHRDRLRECHPDHFPGDADKAAEAQRVNNARDTLGAMAKDGRLTQYALKAERDRRTGGGHAADPLPRTLIILVILGVAGSGKTRGWCEATAQRYAPHPGMLVPGHALHVIFACPTIALLEQTWSMLAAGGLTAPVVHMVHSQNTKGGVGPALDRLYPTITASHQQAVVASKIHSGNHIGSTMTSHNKVRSPVDHAVPNTSGRVIVGITGTQDRAPQGLSESRDGGLVWRPILSNILAHRSFSFKQFHLIVAHCRHPTYGRHKGGPSLTPPC